MDRRLTPANERVAARHLAGLVAADRFVDPTPARVILPVADLCAAPGGTRQRQVLMGAAVEVFEVHAGFAFVQASDGYVGYLSAQAVGDAPAPTHRVVTLATHAYSDEDFKSPDVAHLSFGAQVHVAAERAKFWETTVGFVPKKHLRPLHQPFADPATVAQLHFQVPYLWGGNSTLGLDCSGLIAAALTACGRTCPGDSDLQGAELGQPVADGYQRGDLVFWQGHVGMMVDEAVMIHANAHHMAVAYEPIADATLRIKAQGDGPVLAHKRLT